MKSGILDVKTSMHLAYVIWHFFVSDTGDVAVTSTCDGEAWRQMPSASFVWSRLWGE